MSGNFNNYTGVSFIITSIAIILYGYISFMGLNYIFEGLDFDLLIPKYILSGILVLTATIVVFYCMIVMCDSKCSRNKRQGLRKEIVSGIVIVLILSAESCAFIKFLTFYDQKDALVSDIYQMRDEVSQIDSNYKKYIEKRLEDFHKYAEAQYDKGKEYGDPTGKSLKRRIVPEGLDAIAENRQRWLQTLNSVSVWNVLTPHNVRSIIDASECWADNYYEISSVIYLHERDTDGVYQPFEISNSKELCRDWKKRMSEFVFPDIRTITVFITIIFLTFSSYLMLKRPKNRATGTHR